MLPLSVLWGLSCVGTVLSRALQPPLSDVDASQGPPAPSACPVGTSDKVKVEIWDVVDKGGWLTKWVMRL